MPPMPHKLNLTPEMMMFQHATNDQLVKLGTMATSPTVHLQILEILLKLIEIPPLV